MTAFVLFISAPYMVYFSGLFETAMREHWAHELMHVHFVLVGYLFYESLIGTDPIPYRANYPMRMVDDLRVTGLPRLLRRCPDQQRRRHREQLLRDADPTRGGPTCSRTRPVGHPLHGPSGSFPDFSSSSSCSSSGHATTTAKLNATIVKLTADNDAELAAYNRMLQ